jgi:hypothetical protein
MILGGPRSRVFAHAAPADLRKGFDGLAALVHEQSRADATSGDLYLLSVVTALGPRCCGALSRSEQADPARSAAPAPRLGRHRPVRVCQAPGAKPLRGVVEPGSEESVRWCCRRRSRACSWRLPRGGRQRLSPPSERKIYSFWLCDLGALARRLYVSTSLAVQHSAREPHPNGL